MKRLILCLLLPLLLLSVSCSGNFGSVDLRKPIALGEDGFVSGALLEQIKEENAIAVFTGRSGGMYYEWTVFGSDIGDTRDVSLLVELEASEGGVHVVFADRSDLGFPALLSIHLGEKLDAVGATAYRNGLPIASVALTGSKTSILNLPVSGYIGSCSILPRTQDVGQSDENRPNSSGDTVGQDQYLTDPVPEGKPLPVEPENQEIDRERVYTCTLSIECSTILNNLGDLDPDKLELVPSNGVILPPTAVSFYEGESVFDVLKRVCKEYGIHLEFSWTPIYNSAYIEGIANLYEFDCGPLSGWMYRVNGWYPNYGASRYRLADGEAVEWRFTCDLGKDVGCDWMSGA